MNKMSNVKTIKIRDLVEGYVDNADDGVNGYDGNLNIRPAYQREFVYKDKQRNAVIVTVLQNRPLGLMHWVVQDGDKYELLDGQQRTISICQYVQGDFPVNYRFYHNLDEEEQEAFLDYELLVFPFQGSDKEKLEWFETINIAGEKLTKQELRNAVYHGPWLTDAKRYFSKPSNSVKTIKADKYMKGSAIRQDWLETVLKWASNNDIESYMAEHQDDSYAEDLWNYFESVIEWVESLFSTYRKEMKGVDWGLLYNDYKDVTFNAEELEDAVSDLLKDEDVTKPSGIYPYLITGEEKWLSIRQFSNKIKSKIYEEQKGVCPVCNEHFELDEMEADHITPWSGGGKTTLDNCQLLCRSCNRKKGAK
jgi:hypothetical protein